MFKIPNLYFWWSGAIAFAHRQIECSLVVSGLYPGVVKVAVDSVVHLKVANYLSFSVLKFLSTIAKSRFRWCFQQSTAENFGVKICRRCRRSVGQVVLSGHGFTRSVKEFE